MLKKPALLLLPLVLILVILGFLFFRSQSKKETPSSLVPSSPTHLSSSGKKEEGVKVSLTPKAGKKEVVLKIAKIPVDVVSLEYEILYETKKGSTQGSGTPPGKPIEIKNQELIERTILLGTCSSGGKCVYDEVAGKISVVIKFNKSSGKSTIFSQEYEI